MKYILKNSSYSYKMDESIQYPDMKMLMVDEMMKFPNEFSQEDDLIRIGSIGDGSCMFHSIARGISKPYRSMTQIQRMEFIAQLRKEISDKVTIELYQTLGKGELAYQKASMVVRSMLEGFFVKSCKMDEKDFDHLIGDVCHELKPATYQSFKNKFLELFEEHYEEEEKLNELFAQGLQISLIQYRRELANPRFPVSNDITELVSDCIGVDIYYIDSRDRRPYMTGDNTEIVYKNRLGIIILALDNYHYELIGRLTGNQLRTSFEWDDQLILELRKKIFK